MGVAVEEEPHAVLSRLFLASLTFVSIARDCSCCTHSRLTAPLFNYFSFLFFIGHLWILLCSSIILTHYHMPPTWFHCTLFCFSLTTLNHHYKNSLTTLKRPWYFFFWFNTYINTILLSISLISQCVWIDCLSETRNMGFSTVMATIFIFIWRVLYWYWEEAWCHFRKGRFSSISKIWTKFRGF